MRILQTMLQQTCVYWAVKVLNEEGQATFDPPIEVSCRWEDCTEQFMDKNGNPQTSSAKVYVNVDVPVLLGVLWLPPDNRRIRAGRALEQLTSESDPFANPKAYEIRKFDRLPTLKQRKASDVLRTCWL